MLVKVEDDAVEDTTKSPATPVVAPLASDTVMVQKIFVNILAGLVFVHTKLEELDGLP